MGGSTSGGRSATAKRVLSSILETSGFVCGSLKDTVQDKLADNDMDMKWVEGEIDNIKNKIGPRMEKPREHILNFAEKACAGSSSRRNGNGDGSSSPIITSTGSTNPLHNFMEDNLTLDGTINTMEGGQTLSTINNNDMDDETTTMASTVMTAETPLKHKSRFAPVVDETRKEEKAIADAAAAQIAAGGGTVEIGLCLSHKNSTLGHPDTVTRQTAFDFNELQDRDYKYVSSTDDSGWLAGGGERGDPYLSGVPSEFDGHSEESGMRTNKSFGAGHKIANPDKVYIPIIKIDAASSVVIDEIVAALARGEIFIPEVSVLPETLCVNGSSPPDLVVRFGCEKTDDGNPEDWPNWCLEFLHNQLYDYFVNMGAQWSKRPFQITLARKVRWMTVKHMNKYFARSEQVINSWREKGPQYLKPPHSDDSSRGVILEEITRPHGIYLIQNGVPTNYFAPNFQPPYNTKMRRSLIRNVINKSWDMKHRDWLSEPIPPPNGPVQMISSVMGCANSAPLSPVEESAVMNNAVGAFHMRSDFGLVAESATQETVEHGEQGRKKKSARKDKQGREKHQQNDTQLRQPEMRGEMKQTPSDETFGNSTRPSGTISLSLEETVTDLDNAHTVSASMDSQGRSLSQDGASGGKHFFGSGVHSGRTSSFESSKVSCSDSSFGEGERERNAQQRRGFPKADDRTKMKVCECVFIYCFNRSILVINPFFIHYQSKRREFRDRRQDENGERMTASTPPPNSRRSQYGQSSPGPISPSADSMAYSLDSSSQYRHPTNNTSNPNHHSTNNNINDGAGSVMTTGTDNQSLLSYVTRSTMAQSKMSPSTRHYIPGETNAHTQEEEGDEVSLSLLESNSTVIPNDEELNAIGWAKALDANSGSYYYFTLDRSKTVWENPLA